MKSLIVLLTFIIADMAIGGQYDSINGTKYWISHPLKGNYHQAFRNCALTGMHLISIYTQENHNAVEEVILKWNSSYVSDTHFWTSGTNLGYPQKEFYWAETGYPIGFSNWIVGYPDTSERKCILLHGGTTHQYRWWNEACTAAHYYVCEDKINLPKPKGTECHFNYS